ncbi:serpin B3-like [Planococcus citri]|uniref:serpin B3-like n=1 Tax=Planococcus citri TaxID=170843 RepID=UPI0031F80204
MASDGENNALLLKEILQSNHRFSRDIYNILANDNQDVIFSPISLQVALLLTLSGAHGTTAQEMKASLNLSKEKEEILQGAHLLLENLKNPNLKIASQIFIEQQYKIKDTYENLVKKYLKSSFEAVDFKKSADKATETINSWVSEKTEKKIPNLIPAGLLDEFTRLVLVNAVHFKDEWRTKFSENETYDEPFYSAKDSHVVVPMMHVNKKYRYLEEDTYQVLEIPYKNEDFRLLILLPKQIEGLRQLEEKLSEIQFCQIFYHLETRKVNLTLPKFKMEQFTDMKAVLKKLGMETMFGNSADFSEMYADGEESLCVSDVLHKAVLEINEEGSEAAAATAVMMMVRMCAPMVEDEEPVDFKVDHPFMFLILHRSTILFMGKKSVV